MRGRCCIYDLGTWFQLDRLCSATQSPVHTTFSRERFIYLSGNVWPITPLELNAQHLFVYLRKHQGGRRMTGPFYWACAQSQYGIRPRACMGLGSPRYMIGTGPGACMGPRSWCRTGVFWSFFRFRRYFGHFLGFWGILVILNFGGYFGHFWRF